MVSLKLGNSFSNISGLTDAQFKQLKEQLSYEISAQAAFYGKAFKSTRRSLLTARGDFPSGLEYLVSEFLTKSGLTAQTEDTRIRPQRGLESIKINLPYQPYPEQSEIVSKAVLNARGTISACTGFGKSIAMALLVDKLKVKTLIVVPNLELKRQLTDSFKEYFGDMSNITIENIGSSALKNAKGYDCLIIDEAHHVAAKTYRELNKRTWTDIYYRFFFTATPFRSKDEEQLLFESIAGKVIYRIDYSLAVKKGYIMPLEAYYIDLPKTVPKGNTRSWPAMYSELVVNNEVRNNKIVSILETFHENKISTLCLVKEIKHGDILSTSTDGCFANGQSEDTVHFISMFNSRKLYVLIGTTGVLGEGVDTKPCEYVVIAGLGKSKNQFMQQCGRAFRRYKGKDTAKVIIFRDASHKWSLAHYKAQVKYLKEEYGIIPIKLDL